MPFTDETGRVRPVNSSLTPDDAIAPQGPAPVGLPPELTRQNRGGGQVDFGATRMYADNTLVARTSDGREFTVSPGNPYYNAILAASNRNIASAQQRGEGLQGPPVMQAAPVGVDAVAGAPAVQGAQQQGADISGLLQAPAPAPRGSGGGGASLVASFANQARERAADVPSSDLDFDGANKTLADQQRRIADERFAQAGMVNEQATALNQQNMAEEEARQAELRRRAQQVNDEIDRVSNMRIDPNNWFASRGTVGAIGAALAVGLGAAAQSLQGGQNNALGIINAAIDRDMQAQEANLRAAGQRIGDRQNALQQLRAQYGDERTAREAYRMRSLQVAERMAEQAVQRASTPSAREIAAEQLAAIRGESLMGRQRFEQQLALQANEQAFEADKMRLAAAMRRSGGGQRRTNDDAQLRLSIDQAVGQLYPNATPEQRQAAVNNMVAIAQRGGVGAIGQSTAGMAVLQRIQANESGGGQAQSATGISPDTAALRSRVNAEIAAGQSGFGRYAGVVRSMEPGPLRELASIAGQAAGLQIELSPSVAAELAQYQARRTQLIGSAQTDQERADLAESLPVLSHGWRSEAEAVRMLQNARASADAIERQRQATISADVSLRQEGRAAPRQSVLSSRRR